MPKPKRRQLSTWIGARGSERLVNHMENPTNDEIRTELESLPGGDQISCIELRLSKTDYIEAGGSTEEGFYIRFQEYSEGGQYEAKDKEITLDETAKLLQDFQNRNEDWRSAVEWRRIEIKNQLSDLSEQRELDEENLMITKVGAFIKGFLDGMKK